MVLKPRLEPTSHELVTNCRVKTFGKKIFGERCRNTSQLLLIEKRDASHVSSLFVASNIDFNM